MTNDAPPPEDELSVVELRQRLDGLEHLLDVTRRIAREIDVDAVLQAITDEAAVALDCERATLYQHDAEAGELFTRVVTELEIAEIRNPLDRGISGSVAREQTLANVPNPSADPRWNSTIDQQTGFKTRSILAAPLVSPHDGELLGVLEAINKRGSSFLPFDEQLIAAFCGHAAAALDRLRLVEQLSRRQEVEISLNVAREIQQGFMPHQLPRLPGYELASWWFPNEAVGGDYCDVLRLRDGRTAMVIADVSGHGLGPSLLMASVRAGLRALAMEHSAPEVLMALLGRSMAADLSDGRFITVVLAQIDPNEHTVEFANAGHAPALHYSAASDEFHSLDATGLPLGVVEEPDFPPARAIHLAPGDLLVLCTDGIVEAFNAEDEQFGRHRLKAIIRQHADRCVDDLVREVGLQLEKHYVGDSPSDDLTILAARRLA